MNTISNYRKRFASKLKLYMPKDDTHIGNVFNAVNYSLDSNGKSLRPILVYATAESFALDVDKVDIIAVAIECIHTYSLIHDDLPAMDNDDLRRGRASCHKQFDDATAILAGDALNTYAFELLAKYIGSTDANIRLKQIQTLANYAGIFGMISGQDTDLTIENSDNLIANVDDSLIMLQYMHINKTAKLITACLVLPYQDSANWQQKIEEQLIALANDVGLYYQIQDDILDVTQTSAILGKPSGSDDANHKITYTSLLGLDNAILVAEKLQEKITKQLQLLDLNDSPLTQVINYITKRDH